MRIQQPPKKKRDFDFVAFIGKGSFGVVREAVWGKMHVAVKTVTKDASCDKTLLEAEISTNMFHPNVVASYLYLVEDDPPWSLHLIQELCDGDLATAFRNRLLRNVNMDLPNYRAVLQLCRHIAGGMEYIHKRNVVHGDLNPRNVLLLGAVAKVADFGMAAWLRENAVKDRRGGTPFYIAPEVLEDHMLYKASDVYSFGVIMWEAYTGVAPFVPIVSGDRVKHIAYDGFPAMPSHTPTGYRDLVFACLAKNPDDRPSFTHIISKLRRLRDRYKNTTNNATTSVILA